MERSQPGAATGTDAAGDNLIVPFRAERAGASGRLVRLGSVVDEILARHAYPEPVSKLLGEAVTLTALLGAALKFDGTFILQTNTDGPVHLLVADYSAPGQVRGHASFDAEQIAALEGAGEATAASLLGKGHMAMTIDQGADMERYQGVVPLENCDLNDAADIYFRRSVQLDTFLRVAVAQHYEGGKNGKGGRTAWRAGGLLVQNLSKEGGREAVSGASGCEGSAGEADDPDSWNRVRILAATVEDEELVDPMLAPERLLYRLFHEESVRAYRPTRLSNYCRCSRERVQEILARFQEQDLEGMVEDGKIRVTCEFCNKTYSFDSADYL